jgi:hypothetical protein
VHNCSWGYTKYQNWPLQVDTLLELLGKDSKVEKISLQLKDEKLHNFEVLVNRLKFLRELEIIFPESTQLIELSELLGFS